MQKYLENMLAAMRPAFSREATFFWFVVAFAGFVTRTDNYGVTSIVRALWLDPACYNNLLNFFGSTAWTAETLMRQWRKWLVAHNAAHTINGRLVFAGDHTKVVKDGGKIPEVETLHQDSETGGKPSFFRGHHWGCVSLLIKARNKYYGAPMWAEIHRDSLGEKRTTRIVNQAGRIAESLGCNAYLVLDAYFAVGPVFIAAKHYAGRLPILTRAKKNIVAYLDPAPETDPSKRGPKRKYGAKLKLMELFDDWAEKFDTTEALVYDKVETVRYLALDLIWKPVKGRLRFILIESSRGRIVLMTSDMNMECRVAIKLYCHRVTVETLFDGLKNLLGGMAYHFWSQYLETASRKPKRNCKHKRVSSRPEKTEETLGKIEKFVAVQMVVLGTLQLLACSFGREIHDKANCWLRTPCGEIPSVFVTKTALARMITRNLLTIGKDGITQIIINKKKQVDKVAEINKDSEKVA